MPAVNYAGAGVSALLLRSEPAKLPLPFIVHPAAGTSGGGDFLRAWQGALSRSFAASGGPRYARRKISLPP
jgi:hypothetical protein